MDLVVGLIGFVLTLIVLATVSSCAQRALASTYEVAALQRSQQKRRRSTWMLSALILLAVVYDGMVVFIPRLSGLPMLDGSIGVALGLNICSHPAANAVDLLFFERETLDRLSEWPVVRWLALNLVVLLAGWSVIFVGLRRLLERAG